MKLAQQIFKTLPERAQEFISYAQSYPDNYLNSVMVIKGMQIFIYKVGDHSGEPIFRYTVNDGFYEDGEFREMQFRLNGGYYTITAYPDRCDVSYRDINSFRSGTIENDKVTCDQITIREVTSKLTEFYKQELLIDN